jgi:acylaminoacyl-peptidase
MPRPPEGADWAERPDYIDQTYYRSDGGGYTDGKHGNTHLNMGEMEEIPKK